MAHTAVGSHNLLFPGATLATLAGCCDSTEPVMCRRVTALPLENISMSSSQVDWQIPSTLQRGVSDD